MERALQSDHLEFENRTVNIQVCPSYSKGLNADPCSVKQCAFPSAHARARNKERDRLGRSQCK
eukprot:5819554-Pyramimonas_sp.AAC.1